MSLDKVSKWLAGGMLVIGIACLVSVWQADRHYRHSLEVAQQRFEVTALTAQLASDNRLMTQYARLYVSSGNEAYREQYRQLSREGGVTKMRAQLLGLSLLPQEQRLLRRTAELNEQQVQMEQLAITERSVHGASQQLEQQIYVNTELEISRALDELRDGVFARLSQQAAESIKQATAAQRLAALMLIVTVFYVVLVMLLFVRRGLLKPLRMLTEQTLRLQAGEAIESLANCRVRNELGALARALDAYRQVNQQILHRVRLGPISTPGEVTQLQDSVRLANLGQPTLVKGE